MLIKLKVVDVLIKGTHYQDFVNILLANGYQVVLYCISNGGSPTMRIEAYIKNGRKEK